MNKPISANYGTLDLTEIAVRLLELQEGYGYELNTPEPPPSSTSIHDKELYETKQ